MCRGICISDPDGSRERKLTDNEFHFAPSWSPNGERIVFQNGPIPTTESDVGELYVINVDGTGLRRLTDSPEFIEVDPHFSADGTQVVFGGYTCPRECTPIDLYTVNASDGGDLTRLTTDAYAESPAWSSNGLLAWESGKDEHYSSGGAKEHEIYVDGVNVTNETSCAPPPEDTCTSHDFDPDWAPDGSYLVFTRYTETGYEQDATIMRVNPDGSGLQALVAGEDPALSPDGTKLAFSRNLRVYVSNADGTNAVRTSGDAFGLNWGEGEPYEMHARSVTFKMKDHEPGARKVTIVGKVTVPDGFKECADRVLVTIQQKNPNWYEYFETRTGAASGRSSSYRVQMSHWLGGGKFRAVIAEEELLWDDCARDTSPIFNDRH